MWCILQAQTKQEDYSDECDKVEETVSSSTTLPTSPYIKPEQDLIGTPLECPFDLNVLKIMDEEFYSKEVMESPHHSELKSSRYVQFPSFEARYFLYFL